MDGDRKDPEAVRLSPRSTRAVAAFALRIRNAFPGCPEGTARDAAIRWSRTTAPKDQEREARITHGETVRNALIEHVRMTLTDWPAAVEAGRADGRARKAASELVRRILAAWTPAAAAPAPESGASTLDPDDTRADTRVPPGTARPERTH